MGVELAFESRAIGLSGAASEVFDVVGGHGTMVAQVQTHGGIGESVFGAFGQTARTLLPG